MSTLPFRLVRIELNLANGTPESLYAVGAPLVLGLQLVSNAETGKLIGNKAREAAHAANAPLRELGALLDNGEPEQRVRRLADSLAQVRRDSVAAAQLRKEALAGARKALAEGTDPEPHEQQAREAAAQETILNNRAEALAPLLAAAQNTAAEHRRRALKDKRAEVRAVAERRFAAAQQALVEALGQHVGEFIVARASLESLATRPDDLVDDLQDGAVAALKKNEEEAARMLRQRPAAALASQQQPLMEPDERLPAGVERWY